MKTETYVAIYDLALLTFDDVFSL